MSRSAPALEQLAQLIGDWGGRAHAIPCDVTDPEQVDQALARLARVDVAVNSAGSNIPEPFTNVSTENLNALIDLNIKGTFFVAQGAVRRMLADGSRGAIINVTSQMGHVGAPNRTVYCMTKHAIEGLTKALAVELAPAGIRVNSVAPTFIETEMTRPFFDDPEFRADVESRIPLGRVGQVQDVVGAVLFLASGTAGLVTGTSLLVDGGWTAC